MEQQSLETTDDDAQVCQIPPYQILGLHQASNAMNYTVDNHPPYLANSIDMDSMINNPQGILPSQIRGFDTMAQFSVMQPPVQSFFDLQDMPLSFFPDNQLDIDNNTFLNLDTHEDFTTQRIEESLPFTFDNPNTLMLSSPMQQLDSLVIQSQMSWPINNTFHFDYNTSSFAINHQIPRGDQPQDPSRLTHPPVNKRAPKTATMSAKRWAPAENRIRQLFLDEKKGYKDLAKIVNEEFGFIATLVLHYSDSVFMLTFQNSTRQYKAKIESMRLQRNVKKKDQIAIIRQIYHRKNTIGKDTRYVRAHGHRVTEDKLQRWMKLHKIKLSNASRPLSCNSIILSKTSIG